MIQQFQITLPAFPRGFHLISDLVFQLPFNLPESGMMHVFIKHTSAGIMINENADPSVLHDFEASFNHLVKENEKHYTHTMEGSDDMPAHIKASLVGSSVTIPISGHKPDLGTWQGVYLCEFRNRGGRRKLVVTVYH